MYRLLLKSDIYIGKYSTIYIDGGEIRVFRTGIGWTELLSAFVDVSKNYTSVRAHRKCSYRVRIGFSIRTYTRPTHSARVLVVSTDARCFSSKTVRRRGIMTARDFPRVPTEFVWYDGRFRSGRSRILGARFFVKRNKKRTTDFRPGKFPLNASFRRFSS